MPRVRDKDKISYYLSQVANNIPLNNLGENPRFTISLLGLGQETEHQGTKKRELAVVQKSYHSESPRLEQ